MKCTSSFSGKCDKYKSPYEISEWGIYKLGGVDFDTLTSSDIERLDQFMVSQNGYIKEEVA